MPGVNVPQKQPGMVEAIAPAVGSAIGGYFGGPVGAAAGGKIGGSLAGQPPPPGAVKSSASQDAMGRRIDTLQGDPQSTLAQGDAALQQLPPEYQAAYGPTIQAARQRAQYGGMA